MGKEKSKKKIVIFVVIGILIFILIGVGSYFTIRKIKEQQESSQQIEETITVQEISIEEIGFLEEQEIVRGIKELTLEKDQSQSIENTIDVKQEYVKNIEIDDSKVDFNTEGEYEVTYTITFDGAKLRELLKKENIEVGFKTDSDTITIKVISKVTINSEVAKTEEVEETPQIPIEEEEIVEEEKVVEENKTEKEEQSSSEKETSTTTSSSNSTSAVSKPSQSTHTHTWKEHTAQRWVSNIVTVVDEPEQTVSYYTYRMYWYTTGKWEETRDHARFDEWYKSKDGGLYQIYHPYENPEDHPLFIKYNEDGNPTFTNDHVIIGPIYEKIPAVTHEEDQGHYETYVDYYYCDCGARK